MGTEFILWDHDGVLVDTEPWFFEATQRTLRDFGVEVSREHWLTCQARGLGLNEVAVTSDSVDLDIDEIRRVRDDLYEQLLRDNEVVIAGAADVLQQMADHFRMALVTTSLRRFVDQLHLNTSLLDHFEHVITAEDCSRHKPDPEPYLRAMQLLGATAAQSIAVEDSLRGLTSAISAGLRCFVLRSDFMPSEFDGAHAVLDDIRELPARLSLADDDSDRVTGPGGR